MLDPVSTEAPVVQVEAPDEMPALERILDWVRHHPMSSGRMVAVCVWGDAGVGKTAIIERYAVQRNHGFRVYQPAHDADRGGLAGIAYMEADSIRTRYAPPAFLPSPADAGIFSPTGVLFIDEINRASQEVLGGLLELIGEGRLSHSGYELPRGWQIVCAANPPDGGEYEVEELDPALKNRMLHIASSWDKPAWVRWARGKGIEPDIIRFAIERADIVREGRAELPPSINPIATPRALEYFGALYEPQMPLDLLALFARGLLGERAAEAFIESRKGEEVALTGSQVISGVWERYFPRWREHAPEFLNDSLRALVGELSVRPVSLSEARGLLRLRDWLDPDLRERMDQAIGQQAPDWQKIIAEAAERASREEKLRSGAANAGSLDFGGGAA